jgi:hypothetical protein
MSAENFSCIRYTASVGSDSHCAHSSANHSLHNEGKPLIPYVPLPAIFIFNAKIQIPTDLSHDQLMILLGI